MTNQIIIEVFTDFIWPWCYLSTGRIERLKKEHNVEIRWTYFPLHPEIPAEGMTIQELFPGLGERVNLLHAQMKERMDQEDLPYDAGERTFNTRLAQELAKWADGTPKGDALHKALYEACFVDGRNIGDITELLKIAEEVNLPIEEAKEILETRRYKAEVDEDWQRSRQLGVTGVPTFISPSAQVVGAQPYQNLLALIGK